MPRPIQATIHTKALQHNVQRVRQAVGAARVWAVVKANAYGHGIARVFSALSGADGFALLDFNEAILLRELGWRGPILLLEGVFEAADLDICAAHDLWHTVHSAQQLAWLQEHRAAYRHHVFLKLNSGMNRLGFAPEAFLDAHARLAALPNIASMTRMTHFADADTDQGIARQLAVFAHTGERLSDPQSLSNSAAILRYGQTVHSDWVRAGIMLYGSAPDYPAHDSAHWDLHPAMSLHGRILAVQHVRAGDTVGYGSTFVADKPMRIGVAAGGYADGYPRSAPTGTPILVDGVPTRVLGRISMDMVTVDLEPVAHADCGSEVTFWGKSAAGTLLPIDAVAHASGTVGYELMCALAQRVPVRVDGA